jgi:protein ImuA
MVLYGHTALVTMQTAFNCLESPAPQHPREPQVPVAAMEAVPAQPRPSVLPPGISASIWRGSELGQAVASTCTSGWDGLDAELPGGGWPLRSITEVLSSQPSVMEWRLLAPALKRVVANGGQIVVVGPPRHPHLPGLMHEGLDERHLVWIRADAPSERMWVTEQLIKSNSAGAVVAWLPQARQEQLRRLQVCAQACEGLVFLCRPTSARHEASASPLRVHAWVGLDWELKVNVFKRRGPVHDGDVVLQSVPGGLSAVMTPRLRKPSKLISGGVTTDVVGSTSSAAVSRRHAAFQ